MLCNIDDKTPYQARGYRNRFIRPSHNHNLMLTMKLEIRIWCDS